jgi:hypothetical protein
MSIDIFFMIHFFNISQYVNLTIFFCDISVIYHKFPTYYDMSIDTLDLGTTKPETASTTITTTVSSTDGNTASTTIVATYFTKGSIMTTSILAASNSSTLSNTLSSRLTD